MPERPRPPVPRRVFITGGGGFIGRALGSRLTDLGATVTGLDLTADPDAGILAGSTTAPEPWAHALDGVDVVVHTAAILDLDAAYDDAWSVNVAGTRRVVDAAVTAGVRRFVHISSGAAYGHVYPAQVTESWPSRVTGASSYGDTKVNSEAVVLAAHAAGEIDVVVIRPGDVYGPGSVWVREPLRLARIGELVLPNGGQGVFHPVYIDNLVDGVILALAAPQASGQIFNLADEASLPAEDYFGRLVAWAGLDLVMLPPGADGEAELGPATARMLNRPGDLSIAKAREMLGYEPMVDLDTGLRLSEEWARSQGLI